MSTSIMVVEHEVLIAHDIRRILTGSGYDAPPLVTTGSDALSAAEARSPDLVLMDIKLKGPIGGVETAVRLHEKHRTAIVYLTSHSDEATLTHPGLVTHGLRSGFTAMLPLGGESGANKDRRFVPAAGSCARRGR